MRPTKARLVLLALALAAGLFWIAARSGRSAGAPRALAAVGATPRPEGIDTELPAARSPELGELPRESRKSNREAEVAGAPEASLEVARAEPILAHVVGRFLLPGGAPAIAAEVRIRSWPANQSRVIKHGVPKV